MAALFESHRRRLRGLAYRMLGSRSEAEDVVQDTWLRWQGADTQAVEESGAYLTRIATYLCLDRLRSARARREQYVGLWLPEPLIDSELGAYCEGPEVALGRAQDVSFAFMLALQRLSPLECAVFLLHDVFDIPFEELAAVFQRSSSACRQLASRARQRMRSETRATPGRPMDDAHTARLLAAFATAVTQGDLEALMALLADDVYLYSDGGGVVCAVPRPLGGLARVAQVLIGFATTWQTHGGAPQAPRPASINGMPGAVLFDAQGRMEQVVALAFDTTGRVRGVYFQRNPDKLQPCALRELPGRKNG